MKTIWVKKENNGNVPRRCLNCGKDISNKRSDAKFCCPECYRGYYGLDHKRTKHDLYLFNSV